MTDVPWTPHQGLMIMSDFIAGHGVDMPAPRVDAHGHLTSDTVYAPPGRDWDTWRREPHPEWTRNHPETNTRR